MKLVIRVQREKPFKKCKWNKGTHPPFHPSALLPFHIPIGQKYVNIFADFAFLPFLQIKNMKLIHVQRKEPSKNTNKLITLPPFHLSNGRDQPIDW